MPVTFDAVTSAMEEGGDGVLSLTHTSTGANRAVFAGVGLQGTGTSTSVTYGGTSMTEMWDLANNNNRTAGYSLAGQATGAQTVTSTVTATSDHVLGVISMTDVDQTTPVGTAATATGSTSPATVTVTGVGSDDLVVDNCALAWTGSPLTVGSDQTQRYNLLPRFNGLDCAGSTQLGTAGGVMSWTLGAGDFWATGAVAFKPVAAGGRTTRNTLAFPFGVHLGRGLWTHGGSG